MKGFKLSHNKKPSRAVAFDIALMIAADRPVSQEEKDMLVNYFSPTVASPKTIEQWVAKAAGVKDVRPYLQAVYVENGVAYATDGSCIHWAKTDMQPGWYDPKSLLSVKGPDREFPDVAGRFLTSATRPIDGLEVPDEQLVRLFKNREIFYKVVQGVPVDVKYLNPALKAPGVTGWKVSQILVNTIRVDAVDGSCGFIISGLRM